MELQTDRLLLRPVAESDFERLFEIFTNEAVRKYLFDDNILSVEQMKSLIATSMNNFECRSYGLWLLTEKATGISIGVAGLWPLFDEAQPQLLYALLPQATGNGFATEVSKRLIDYAFHQLSFSYLMACCDVPNVASHKVALRAGMKKIKEEVINGLSTVFFAVYKEPHPTGNLH